MATSVTPASTAMAISTVDVFCGDVDSGGGTWTGAATELEITVTNTINLQRLREDIAQSLSIVHTQDNITGWRRNSCSDIGADGASTGGGLLMREQSPIVGVSMTLAALNIQEVFTDLQWRNNRKRMLGRARMAR